MGKAKPVDDQKPELPRQAQVGDRIRLKVEKITEYTNACVQAGYDNFDAYAVRTVTREDPWNPGGGRRLFFDGPPFAFSSTDVMLAWSNEDDRRKALRAQGWKL